MLGNLYTYSQLKNQLLIPVIFSLDPPAFLSPEPEMLELIVGAEIILNCTATGNPTPVYSWQSSHPIQERMEDEAVFTSSSLLPGTYTCTASNKLDKKSKQFIIKAKSTGRADFEVYCLQLQVYHHVLCTNEPATSVFT